MFIRSKDGKRITEVHEVELKGTDLIVNGKPFESYDSEEEAAQVIASICLEMSAFETFLDLSGEYMDDFDDDDDDDFWDDDDDDLDDDDDDPDDDDELPDAGDIIFTDKNGKPFFPFN